MKDQLQELPSKKSELEETGRLLERLEDRKGKTDPDRYERLHQRYEEKIEELENRLSHHQVRIKEAEAELEEIEALYQEGAMDEETYREEWRRHRKQKSDAQKKASQIERELDEVKFYLIETGEVSCQKEKLEGHLSGARSQVRQWTDKAWFGVIGWLTGVIGSNLNLLGMGAAVAIFLTLSVGWLQGSLGQVQETSNRMEYTPMFRGGVARTGTYSERGPQEKPAVQWRFETGNQISSSPAVANGFVYVGSTDGNLYAVDVRTGNVHWSFEAGFMVLSSPAMADGTVYFGGGDGNLYAVDARTGNAQWTFKTEHMVRSSPAVAGGTVYVGGDDGNLYAVDAEAGDEQWSFETGGSIRSSPAVFGGTAYVGSDDSTLYAVNARTGNMQWSFKTGARVRSTPAVAGGTVYVGSDDGNLYAIGAQTGNKQWSFETGEEIRSSPAVAGGTVYVGGDDGILRAVDAQTGNEEWDFELKAGITNEIRSSPVVVGESVYIGSNNGNLYGVDAQLGSEQWGLEVGASVTSTPAVVDGIVYLGTNELLALRGKRSGDEPVATNEPSSEKVPSGSDRETSKSNQGPSEAVIRSAIVSSLEEGEVPQTVYGPSMITSCVDGSVENLTIRGVGRKQKRLGKTYWPVKFVVTGSCTQGSSCGPDHIMGECRTVTFDEAEAEFAVWEDPYGDWKARVLSR